MRRITTVCTLVLALSACMASEDESPRQYTVRDSSGVRIVEYAEAPVATRTIAFSAEPVFRHGDGDGEHLFERIFAGALQSDGGVVVADVGANEIVAIAPDGTLRSILAHEGQGPGEVRQVSGLQVIGSDVVIVEDDGNGKIMLFEKGTFAGSLSTMDDISIRRGLRSVGIDSGRRLLMVTSSYDPRFTQPWLQGHMARIDLSTGAVDTVGAYDLASNVPMEGPMNPFSPFGAVTATGDGFVHGRTDLPELTWREGPDRVRQILRWNTPRIFPTDEHMTMLENRLRVDMPRANPGASQEMVEEIIQRQLSRYQLDSSKPLPLFLVLESDGAGGVWMGDFVIRDFFGGIPRYTVISADGEWLGTVELPAGFRLLDVAGDRVLGVLKDELDVESVAVFTITNTPAGGQP